VDRLNSHEGLKIEHHPKIYEIPIQSEGTNSVVWLLFVANGQFPGSVE